MIVSLYNVITTSIYAQESFENLPIFNRILKDERGSLKKIPIVLTRLGFLSACYLLYACFSSLSEFMESTGNIVAPLVGIIFPIIFSYSYRSTQTTEYRTNKLNNTLDLVVLIFGMFILVLGCLKLDDESD